MKPPAFEYSRPVTVEETLGLLRQHGADAKVLAGGQSLVPLMNFRLAQPAHLIDVNALDELDYVRDEDGALRIGALTRQATVEDSTLVENRCPLLADATRLIGHRTVRNRGTVGGNVAHADPTGEYPTLLVALDGQVVARSSSGERVIPAAELFHTIFTTTLDADELLTEVRVPVLPDGTGWAYEELSLRHGDYAQVGVAATVRLDAAGRFEEVRLALAAVGEIPLRCRDAEATLTGRAADDAAIAEAGAGCAAVAEPQDDMHASATYKTAMVEVFVSRALRRAMDQARRA